MLRRSNELIFAFLSILLIGAGYIFVVYRLGSIPAASDLFGHSLGIMGFTLMLMTETLYSLRKRSRNARWGKMSNWLQFHIYTGLVGPFMVLLHSSWKFNGIAGIVLLLTGMIVLSGFIGRYIFTAIPRDIQGIEVEAQALNREINSLEARIQSWLTSKGKKAQNESGALWGDASHQPAGVTAVFGRFFAEIQENMRFIRFAQRMDLQTRQEMLELNRLLRERARLKRSVDTLATSRRILAFWHAVHIPLGVALFSLALVHIVAAIYYATLLQ